MIRLPELAQLADELEQAQHRLTSLDQRRQAIDARAGRFSVAAITVLRTETERRQALVQGHIGVMVSRLQNALDMIDGELNSLTEGDEQDADKADEIRLRTELADLTLEQREDWFTRVQQSRAERRQRASKLQAVKERVTALLSPRNPRLRQ